MTPNIFVTDRLGRVAYGRRSDDGKTLDLFHGSGALTGRKLASNFLEVRDLTPEVAAVAMQAQWPHTVKGLALVAPSTQTDDVTQLLMQLLRTDEPGALAFLHEHAQELQKLANITPEPPVTPGTAKSSPPGRSMTRSAPRPPNLAGRTPMYPRRS